MNDRYPWTVEYRPPGSRRVYRGWGETLFGAVVATVIDAYDGLKPGNRVEMHGMDVDEVINETYRALEELGCNARVRGAVLTTTGEEVIDGRDNR